MKRKYLLVLGMFVLLMGLCACTAAAPSNESAAVPSETVAVESEQTDLSESAVLDETVNENDAETQEELWWHDEALYEQYTLYAKPYAKAMLCGTTWSDPGEIEVWQLINFYMYNSFAENEEYLALGDVEEILVPEDEVIGYITTFFDVSPDYLKTSEKYLPDEKAFRFQPYMGGGMGPLARFTCDAVDDKLYLQFENEFDGEIQPYYTLTIQLDTDGGYKYIEGARLISESTDALDFPVIYSSIEEVPYFDLEFRPIVEDTGDSTENYFIYRDGEEWISTGPGTTGYDDSCVISNSEYLMVRFKFPFAWHVYSYKRIYDYDQTYVSFVPFLYRLDYTTGKDFLYVDAAGALVLEDGNRFFLDTMTWLSPDGVVMPNEEGGVGQITVLQGFDESNKVASPYLAPQG